MKIIGGLALTWLIGVMVYLTMRDWNGWTENVKLFMTAGMYALAQLNNQVLRVMLKD